LHFLNIVPTFLSPSSISRRYLAASFAGAGPAKGSKKVPDGKPKHRIVAILPHVAVKPQCAGKAAIW
jgi:hypothetical protein